MFSSGLRDHLRLVFVDLRHFGVSDPSFDPSRMSRQTYADDIESIRQALQLGEVILIGQSIHGTIALDYAKRHPAHVRGVVVIGAYAYLSDHEPDAAEQLWDTDASPERKQARAHRTAELAPDLLAGLSAEEAIARDYVANAARDWYDASYDPSWLWVGVKPNVTLFEPLFGELFANFDLDDPPAPVIAPVLIAQGRYDYNAAYTLWEEHRHKLPHHTYTLFQRSGHYPPLEEPQLFDDALLAWIRGLDQPGD
jgi:proline iminopeptidase